MGGYWCLLNSCLLSSCSLTAMLPMLLLSAGPISLPTWQRQPELILHALTGLQTWPFLNAQGVLNHCLFESQHFHSPHISSFATYILSCCPCFGPSGTCGRRVGSLENCVDANFRATQLHPESLLLENHLSKSARGILKDSRWFHT